MKKTLFASITSIVFGILFVFSGVHAGSVSTLTGTLTDSDGAPIAGMAVSIFDSSDNQLTYTTTDSTGVFSMSYDFTDGAYTIIFSPTYSYDCSDCALYQELSESITVDSATYGSSEQALGTFQMVAVDRYVKITVVDQNGAPVAGVTVNAWGQSYSWAYGTTDVNGEYSFAWNEDTVSFGVYASDGMYTSTYEYDVPVATTGETPITVEVEATDATIVANLVDSDGNPFVLGDYDYASVYCSTVTENSAETSPSGESHSGSFFEGYLTSGYSSTTIGVVAGSYTCGAWVMGYGVRIDTPDVTVASGESAAITVTLIAYDALINVEYVDTDGNVITDITSFMVYGSSTTDPDGNPYYNDYVWGTGENGQATIEALGGYTYEIGSWFDSGSASDYGDYEGMYITSTGATYIQSYEMHTVTANAAEPQTVQITLQKADATLDVTVLDVNGDPVSYGWVSAMEGTFGDAEGTEGHGWSNFVGGMTDGDGLASLAVVSGVKYTVYAWTHNAFDGSVLPPAHQTVVLSSGETQSITMQEQATDWTLNIAAENETDTAAAFDSYDYTYCYGYSPELGVENFAEIQSGSGTMGLVRGGDWYIGCMGYADNTFYRSVDTLYTPGDEEGGSGDVTITLQNAGEFYDETSYTASGTSASTITLPDGESTITIPANTITDSGNYTLTVSTATGYSVNDNNFPVEAFNFSVLDSSGSEVTDFASNLTLKLAYDEEMLAQWGVDEATLVGGAYGDNNNWESPVATSLDAENNQVIITLNHFSSYAVLGDRGVSVEEETAPGKPRDVTAKKIKRHSVIIDWKKPAGDTEVTKYKVQVRKFKVTKRSKYRKFNNVTVTQRKVKELKADTRYQYRVRACNDTGCSSWTKWKKFTTKAAAVVE